MRLGVGGLAGEDVKLVLELSRAIRFGRAEEAKVQKGAVAWVKFWDGLAYSLRSWARG